MIQKFYSIKGRQVILPAMVVSTIFAFVIAGGAYYTGALTRVFCSPELTPDLFTPKGPEFDKLVPYVITNAIPQAMSIIILLLVLSASMSTLSSLVLVSSSAIAVDIVAHVLKGQTDEKLITRLMRFLCALFVIVSVVIALKQPAIIVTLMSLSWGTVAGCFLAPFLYGLYWKGTTKIGAIAGSLSGLVISVILFIKLGEKGAPLAGSIAMIVPLLVVPLVSLFTPKPDKRWLKNLFSDF